MDNSISNSKIKQIGQFYLWQYTENYRNYSGWNFTVDNKGCEFLIGLLKQMQESKYSSQYDLSTLAPSSLLLKVPNNNNGQAAFKTISKLTLKHIKNPQTDSFWELTSQPNQIIITFSSLKLQEFQSALEEIKRGNGDFGITDDYEENDKNLLFFWWMPKHS